MQEVLAIEFRVRGYHVTTTYVAAAGEELLCDYEASNMNDML